MGSERINVIDFLCESNPYKTSQVMPVQWFSTASPQQKQSCYINDQRFNQGLVIHDVDSGLPGGCICLSAVVMRIALNYVGVR